MDVTLLGTGTLVPESDRGSTALMVEGSGEVVPIDLGRGALSRMVEVGVDPVGLCRFFVTHLHPDHTSELVPLLFALRHGRPAPLPVELIGPVGLARLVARITEAWPSTAPDYPLEIRESEGGVVLDTGLQVHAGPVHHGDHAALGYRVTESRTGRSLAFTGDSGPGPLLLELVQGVDLLVAECGDGLEPGRGRHLDVNSLADLARAADVGRVVVIHVDPRHDRAAVVGKLRELLPGRLIEGVDGLRVGI